MQDATQTFFSAGYCVARMILPKFIKPSELRRFCHAPGLAVSELPGIGYHWTPKTYSLSHNPYVNYILACSA